MHTVRLTVQPFELVSHILHCSYISRSRMTFKILRTSRATTQPPELAALFLRGDLLVGHGLEVLSDPKTTSKASCFLGREYMVGSNYLPPISFSLEVVELMGLSHLITV